MDAAYPEEKDPAQFASWLIERLSVIPGTEWSDQHPLAHTSYDDWHVWGRRTSLEQSSPNLSRPDAGTKEQTSNHSGNQKLIARVSQHALRLERQFQLNQEVLDRADPDGEKHIRALQLLRLPARNSNETSLTVILFEDVAEKNGVNDMRNIVNYGPNFYLFDKHSVRKPWNPAITSGGENATGSVSVREFLDIAIGCLSCLEMLHQGAKFVHGDIRNDCWWYNRETGKVRLQNYGSGVQSFAGGLTSAGWNALSKEYGIEFKLQFVSPESAGRSSIQADTRTDIYSLGICFWNMLTGELPYPGVEPLEVMQNVLSRRVPLVNDKRVDVPDTLAYIIQKMVQKNIENRYYSAGGVRHDLKRVQRLLAEGEYESLSTMVLGVQDVNPAFRLPSLLIGREDQRAAMLKVLRRLPVYKARSQRTSSSMSSDSAESHRSAQTSAEERISDVASLAQSPSNSATMVASKQGDFFFSSTPPTESIEEDPLMDVSSSYPLPSRTLSIAEASESAAGFVRSYSSHSNETPSSTLRKNLRLKRGSRTEVIVLTGAPGMGKSSLVADLQPAVRERKGYFCSGKFDSTKKTPYEPVLAVLSSLFRQIWSEPDSAFHKDLRTFCRPIWGMLSGMLGLPQWLIGDEKSETPRSNVRGGRPGSLSSRRPSTPTSQPTHRDIATPAAARTMPNDVMRSSGPKASSRFQSIFLDVLRFLSSQQLIVFILDDITFADEESLDLLHGLVESRIPILLVLTCRSRDALTARARTLADSGMANITNIELNPLTETQVGQYIAATLDRDTEYVFPLTAVLYERSRGNVLLLKEMLDECHRKGCVSFDWKKTRWSYNLDHVFETFKSDEYASQVSNDFLIKKLMELPPNSRKLLAIAAVVGHTFSFHLVKKLMGGNGGTHVDMNSQHDANKENVSSVKQTSPPHKVDMIRQASLSAVQGLQAAISAYVIIPVDDDHFAFCHDRYQQAAAALPECKRPQEIHFNITKLVMTHECLDRNLYNLSSHISAAIDIIKERCFDRRQYRDILLKAAEKNVDAGGQASALQYFLAAIALLQNDPWDEDAQPDTDYHETLNLFVRTAEYHWLRGNKVDAMRLLDQCLAKARSVVDKVPAYILKARMHGRTGDNRTSSQILVASLLELGVDIGEGTKEDHDERFNELLPSLEDGTAMKVLKGPMSNDVLANACGSIMCEAMVGAFWSDPDLYYRLALAEVELHLRAGNTSFSGLAYIHIAAVAISRFDKVLLAQKVGAAGREFYETFQTNNYAAGRAQVLYAMLVGHFQQHLGSFLPLLEDAVEKSLSTGDRFNTLLTLAYTVSTKIWMSHDMAEVESYCGYGAEEISQWQDDVRGSVVIIAGRQFARAMQGKTRLQSASTLMSDSYHDTQAYLRSIAKVSSHPERSYAFYHSFTLTALFTYGYMREAVELGDAILEDHQLFWSSRIIIAMALYHSLASMALLRQEPEHPRRDFFLAELRRRCIKSMRWTGSYDGNMIVITKLLLSQIQELDGDYAKCLRTYEEAIDHAEVHNFVFEQAQASELYAEFLVRRGANRPARSLLRDAIKLFRSISCHGKASQLSTTHAFLLEGTTQRTRVDAAVQTEEVSDSTKEPQTRASAGHSHDDPPIKGITTQDAFSSASATEALDMIDVQGLLRSSSVLASELNVDRLLTKLTKIILESTGAELTGIIVEDDDNSWKLAAISDTACSAFPTNEPLEAAGNIICTNIALGCLRFKETIITENVLGDSRFSNVNEEYRQRYPAGRAVCCMPIFHGQSTILGCVYIEGAPHTFAQRSTTVLRLLSSSVSTSIYNSMLFKKLEKVSASNAVMVESQKYALAKAREAEKKARLAEEEAIKNVHLKEEAAKAKALFLANVSHELRTPLNGVIGMSELLKGTSLTTEQHGYTESVRVCADTLLVIINDILDYSKLDAGKMVLHSIPMSIIETISEVVRALSFSNVHQRNVKTVTELDIDKDLLVMGDPVRFHQILMNLLSNAYKFTSSGSVIVKATAERQDDKDITITIAVKDSGVGISELAQKKLFLPFSQADSSTARQFGGTGLGLSICKHIVEGAMRGIIWMESELGIGTTVSFTITFPKVVKGSMADVYRERPDPMAAFSPSNAPMAPGQVFSPPAFDLDGVPKSSISIAIAEDNPINSTIAKSYVRKIGYSCEAFENGRLTVDALIAASDAGKPFHLVLMDCQMPVLDGYDATREIRKHSDPVVRNVTIVAMTASAIRGDREACLAAGMNNYLSKPVKQKVLQNLLEGYLEKGAAMQQAIENGEAAQRVSNGNSNRHTVG